MSEATTSINELPTDPTSGGSMGGNIGMDITDVNRDEQSPRASSSQQVGLDQQTISQIVSGLQKASITGATQLPSRDMPTSTEQISADPEIQPNYVPPPESRNYINEIDEDIQLQYQKQDTSSMDSLYDEIQIPILLAVLYFLFQLPVIKNLINTYLSFLCNNDGNYNINGLFAVSVAFGTLFYSITKSITCFSRF